MKDWKNHPTIIRRSRWAGKPIKRSRANQTSVHYHDGSVLESTSGELVYFYEAFGATPYTSSQSAQWDSLFLHGQNDYVFDHYGDVLLTLPRMIRVIHNVGWNYFENYPMVVQSEAADWRPDGSQSIYLDDVNVGEEENCVNYYNIRSEIRELCREKRIAYREMGGSWRGTGYFGPTTPINGVADGFDDPSARGTIGAWLPLTVPYYDDPFNRDFQDKSNTWGDDQVVPREQVVGGEVLNIVFASDAFASYHGGPSTELYNLGGTFSSGALENDIADAKYRIGRMKRWGTIIIHSPKNAEFFPMWFPQHVGNNQGIPFVLPYARDHFEAMEQRIEGVKLLKRPFIKTVLEGTDDEIEKGTAEHHYFNDPNSTHLSWSGPQVTIADIMNEVKSFWSDVSL